MRRVLLVALVSLAVSCGENPYSPTASTPLPAPLPPSPQTTDNLTGTWTGSMTLTHQGRRGTLSTHAEIQHSAGIVGGLWFIATPGNDAKGRIDGHVWFVDAALHFQGIVTWESAAEGGGRCRGQTGFSGPIFDREMTWRAPTMDFGSTCAPVSDISWVMTR